ncbi:MAG TPA: YvcK family protein [Thermodesulfobium narugense]|nr:MAG: hypothetical protein C0174_04705 [Thermodesulfobium narugense]HEM56147.1 YvcK family protein [Thermodesulfobium narugense]
MSFRPLKWLRWLTPGLKIKRWIFLGSLSLLLIVTSLILSLEAIPITKLFIKNLSYFINEISSKIPIQIISLLLFLIGFVALIYSIRGLVKQIVKPMQIGSRRDVVELLWLERQLKKRPQVVVIGGGTGQSTVLRGLKYYPINLTAIVTPFDDGGSSGFIRKELGFLPPGDIRNCLAALSLQEDLLGAVLQYRFKGVPGLEGHPVGNILLAAATEITGDFLKAINMVEKIISARGHVIPSTLFNTKLCAKLKDGSIVKGESNISKSIYPIETIFLDPLPPSAFPEAIKKINEADAIVIGPGSLFTSILPNLLMKDLLKAIRESKAIKIYVCNIMTQPGETGGYKASDHVRAFLEILGFLPFDTVLLNNKKPEKLIDYYEQKGSEIVINDLHELERFNVKIVLADLLYEENHIRHDHKKLAKIIFDNIFKNTRAH